MADENNQERINDFLAEGGIAMVSNNNQSLTKNNSEAMLRATSTVSTIAKKNTTNNATTISTTAASHYNHSANETMGKLPSSELQCDPSYTAITLKTTTVFGNASQMNGSAAATVSAISQHPVEIESIVNGTTRNSSRSSSSSSSLHHDPCFALLAAATKGTKMGVSHSKMTDLLLVLPTKSTTTTATTKTRVSNIPSSNIFLMNTPPTNVLEVEPLMSQMVPQGIADVINRFHKELSKSTLQDAAAAAAAATEGVTKSDTATDTTQTGVPDWQTLPKTLTGKVAFFEKIMHQKRTPVPKLDPTVKIKAEVSDKVKSVHAQVQTSLLAPKANRKKENVVLPSNVTPLAVKKERVQTFFPKSEVEKSDVTLVKKTNPSKWDTVDTTRPSTFENIEDREQAEVSDAQPDVTAAATDAATATLSMISSPAPTVDSLVLDMQQKLDNELDGLKNEFSNFDNMANNLNNKLDSTFAANGNFGSSSEESILSNGHSSVAAETTEGAVEKDALELHITKGDLAATEALEATIDPDVATGDLAATEALKTVMPTLEPEITAAEQASTKTPEPVENILVGTIDPEKEPTNGSEVDDETVGITPEMTETVKESIIPSIATGDMAATEALKTVEETLAESSKPDEEPANGSEVKSVRNVENEPEITMTEPVGTSVDPASTGDLADSEEPKTDKDTAEEDEKAQMPSATTNDAVSDGVAIKATNAVERNFKSISQDAVPVSTESPIIGKISSPVSKTLPVDEFPSLTSTSAQLKHSSIPEKEFSYARALAEGEKKEKEKPFSLHKYLPKTSEVNCTKTKKKEKTSSEQVLGTADANDASSEILFHDKVPIAEENHTSSSSTAKLSVQESKDDSPNDPDFTSITRSSKRRQNDEDDAGKKTALPPIAMAAGVAKKAGSLDKATFNPFDVLVENGGESESPEKSKVPAQVQFTKGKSKRENEGKKQKVQTRSFKAKKKSRSSNKSIDSDDFVGFETPRSTPWLAMPLHLLNNLVHIRPVSYIFDAILWCLMLVIGGPLASLGLVVLSIYKLLHWFMRLFGFGVIAPKTKPGQQLAVVVTGCDSGFGRDLSLQLIGEGFIVFCCCLRKESIKDYKKYGKLAVPIQVDITRDTDVDKASKAVRDWLAKDEDRYLHALVNNAGIGTPGLVDWAPVADFQKMIDVNYIGMVRCCKKFLPIFKQQASQGIYNEARLVNMVSMAGVVTGGLFSVGYEASKHAADAFTTNLRLETKNLGLKVVVINPSFHRTPLTSTMSSNLQKLWQSLSPEKREEYGEGKYLLSFWSFPSAK